MIYYGGDFSQSNVDIMKTFDVVVLHPSSTGLTPAIVKELQDSNVQYVLGYISIGEDSSGVSEGPITLQGTGPIYVDENSLETVYGNGGIASFYVDSVYNPNTESYQHDSEPDVNGIFGGYYVYPNSDWRAVLKNMRIGGTPEISQRQFVAGLDQIVGDRDLAALNTKTANFGFDGFFLDTIDTAGSYAAEGWYPWAAEAMQQTVKFISDTYPNKSILANRGSFYFQAGLKNTDYNVTPIDFSIRPYINAMLFESFMLDSDVTNTGISHYYTDNRDNVLPKLMSEANRPDGFTVTGMDYMMGRDTDLFDQLFNTSVKDNGWMVYLSVDRSISEIDLLFYNKLNNAEQILDTAAPKWMTSGNGYSENKAPRVGVQKLEQGSASGDLTVFWDSAKDQSWPVKYNIYVSTQEDFSDATKHAAVNFEKNTPWNNDPYTNVANKFTVNNLATGTYYVRVRAEDSSASNLEEQNVTTLSITLEGTPDSSVSNLLTQAISVDSDLSDWETLTPFGSDPKDALDSDSALDWDKAWMAHDASNLYFAYQYHNPVNMSWGHITYLDTDTNTATGYTGPTGAFPVGVDYMIQGYHLWHYTGTGNNWAWEYVASTGRSWNQLSSEMYIPRSWIGNPTKMNVYYEARNESLGLTSVDYFPNDAISAKNSFSYTMN